MLHMQVEVTWVSSENLLFSGNKFCQMSQVPSLILAKNQTSEFLNGI